MKLLIAPDKFKGSLDANAVALAMKKGALDVDPNFEIVLHPLADGGEGSIQLISRFRSLQKKVVLVADPLGRKIEATYMLDEQTAFIEMAAASGLQLLNKTEYDPLRASTFGTGQMIANAAEQGVKEIVLFIGGSATNDAGTGMAAALGYRFYNAAGDTVEPSGKSLGELHSVDRSNVIPDLHTIQFTTICDVTNPLYGLQGAAYTFAAQKGADEYEIAILDAGLRHFSQLIQKEFKMNIADLNGAGAAGGMGAGSAVFLGASLQSGIDTLMEVTGFEAAVRNADLVLSGEGKLDRQTLHGKVLQGVARMSAKYRKPLFGVVGSKQISSEDEKLLGFSKCLALEDLADSKEDSMRSASKWIAYATKLLLCDDIHE